MNQPARTPTATEGTYQGKAVLKLGWGPDDQYGFTFGPAKGRLILKLIPEIEAFVERHKNDPRGPRRAYAQEGQGRGGTAPGRPAPQARQPTATRGAA